MYIQTEVRLGAHQQKPTDAVNADSQRGRKDTEANRCIHPPQLVVGASIVRTTFCLSLIETMNGDFSGSSSPIGTDSAGRRVRRGCVAVSDDRMNYRPFFLAVLMRPVVKCVNMPCVPRESGTHMADNARRAVSPVES